MGVFETTDIIGLRERIERRLVGAVPPQHRTTVVGILAQHFNQLLGLRTGNGVVALGGVTSPARGADSSTPLPRLFELIRIVDHSGVSGTGPVAEGVEFADGRVALRWHGANPSTACWDSTAQMLAVHGHGGDTILRWRDQACRVCGCTENQACQPFGCHWVEPDRCSACPAGGRWGHVTESSPTGHIDTCMTTTPTGWKAVENDVATDRPTYHLCRMETNHDGAHHCCACDHSWPWGDA